MNIEGLLSNVGGILSLWLGMTVMFLVEIIELIVSVVTDRFSKNPKIEVKPNTHGNQTNK